MFVGAVVGCLVSLVLVRQGFSTVNVKNSHEKATTLLVACGNVCCEQKASQDTDRVEA